MTEAHVMVRFLGENVLSASNFLLGMSLDNRIPSDIRKALQERSSKLREVSDEALQWLDEEWVDA